jgi:hypothetical protein
LDLSKPLIYWRARQNETGHWQESLNVAETCGPEGCFSATASSDLMQINDVEHLSQIDESRRYH